MTTTATTLEFSGRVWHWAGPAPHHFVRVPAEHCESLRAAARLVTYGWGMIPVRVTLGGSQWTTSLFPKDGGYLVPIRASVRRARHIEPDDEVTLRLEVGVRAPRPRRT